MPDHMMWKCKDEPAPKKFKMVLSSGKIDIVRLLNSKGVIYEEYLPPDVTIIAECFTDTLVCLQRPLHENDT